MDPLRNPYAPGAGNPPPELAGREELLAEAKIALARIQQGKHAKSLMLLGLRGVGKTVLLNEIRKIAETLNYKTASIEVVEGRSLAALLIPALRQVLLSLDRAQNINATVKRALRGLRGFVNAVKLKVGELELGLDIEPEPGLADSGDLALDLSEILVAVAQAAKARGSSVLILVDEIQYLQEVDLGALIMAIHKVSQLQLPLVVIGAGLPQLAGLAGDSKSYAERLFEFMEVGPLSPPDAMEAIREPASQQNVVVSDEALDAIVDKTKGYPYFLQEWGYNLWNLAEISPILRSDVDKASARSIQRLDRSFFRVRFDRLTPSEKKYLRAMAALGPGPHRSGDVAERLGREVQNVAPFRNSLIRKGMIFSPAHGDTAFTVPLFDEFLKREMPVADFLT